MKDAIYTIGHSTYSVERFIDLLRSASITAVGDVRSSPYSRMNPQFGRESLAKALRAADIRYVFLGKELGARPDELQFYRNGQVQFDLMSQSPRFESGLERVTSGIGSFRIALMCAEKEPLECHRTVLVARRLVERGLQVKHILSDGRIEDHAETVQRLLARFKMQGPDMFRSDKEIVEEAYRRQGHEIAYRENELAADREIEKALAGMRK